MDVQQFVADNASAEFEDSLGKITSALWRVIPSTFFSGQQENLCNLISEIYNVLNHGVDVQ